MHDREHDPARPHEGPADTEQTREGFDEGQRDLPENEDVGRFDEGQEDLPKDHAAERRFSEGQEGDLNAEELAQGDFATGEHDDERPPRDLDDDR
jgi:hypothetical protein